MAYFVFGDESGGLANRQDRFVAIDKHFSKPHQRNQVESVLEQLVGQSLDLQAQDSQRNPGIQIADFVAGAALAKYQREDDSYLSLLGRQIVMEEWLSWEEMRKW